MSTIHVPLAVERYTIYQDGNVEVWGLVGDYEVMIFIRIKHAVEDGLLDQRWLDWDPMKMTVKEYEATLVKKPRRVKTQRNKHERA